jgi:hypothetical protein
MRKIVLLLLLLALCLAQSACSGLEEGLTAYNKGDFATAYKIFSIAANQGKR